MKKLILATMIVALIGTAYAFQKSEVKKYPVQYTVAEWQNKIGIIGYTINALKESDLPTKITLPLIDSLSAINEDLVKQINIQVQLSKVDTTNKNKSDTSHPKKK